MSAPAHLIRGADLAVGQTAEHVDDQAGQVFHVLRALVLVPVSVAGGGGRGARVAGRGGAARQEREVLLVQLQLDRVLDDVLDDGRPARHLVRVLRDALLARHLSEEGEVRRQGVGRSQRYTVRNMQVSSAGS